jgi:hypothetical protein
MRKIIFVLFAIIAYHLRVFGQDTIVPAKLDVYKLNFENLGFNVFPDDTSLTNFQYYYPFLEKDYSSVFLGNLGLPYSTAIFRPDLFKDFLFYRSVENYWIADSTVQYLNTTKPYTHMYLFTGPRREKENLIRLMHSRNINQFWNVTLYGSFNIAEGAFNYQNARSSSVYASTNYQKENLRIFSHFLFNKITAFENGGINDSVEIIGNQIPVKMDDASNLLGQKQFNQNLVYTFPINFRRNIIESIDGKDTIVERIVKKELFSIWQHFSSNQQYKVYRDNLTDSLMYGGISYYDAKESFDSIFQQDISIRVKFRTGDEILPIIKIGAFGEYLWQRSEYYNFKEYVRLENGTTEVYKRSRYGLYSARGKMLNWQAYYETYKGGYKDGDYAIKSDGELFVFQQKFPLRLRWEFNYEVKMPSYWMQNYYGNRVIWENETKDETQINGILKLTLPKLNLLVSLEKGMILNPVYFNENALAAQLNDTLNYSRVQMENLLKIWMFRIKTKFTYQQLSDTTHFSYPEMIAYASIYYEGKTISKSMVNQIGIETYWMNQYAAPYYYPATAMFYAKKGDLIGGEPLVNFFINAQLRRSRIFFKVINLNYLVTSQFYYQVPDYPLPDTYFRFGVSWRFYD